MIVYHGSFIVVDKPDVGHSKRYLDFGAGFYVTADQKQAELWAKRKSVRQKANPIVNVYDLNNDLTAYNGLIFAHEDVAWLDFVAKCRKGNDLYKDYDYISGGVANDDVFLTVDMYMRGIWDSDRALSEIRYYKTSHPICIINQILIDKELTFVESYEVK
jgi:hypothetical protein